MFKSVQIKIILIVVMLAIIMFAIPGYVYINYICNLNLQDTETLYTIFNNGKSIFVIIAISFVFEGRKVGYHDYLEHYIKNPVIVSSDY